MSRVGEIILLSFPFSKNAGSKVRPALIISDDDDIHRDLLVAYITTEIDNYGWSDYSLPITSQNLETGVLNRDSLIRLDKLISVSESLIMRNNIARLNKSTIDRALKIWSHLVVNNYYSSIHKKAEDFIPGKSRVNYAGRVFDQREMLNLVDSSLEFWLTYGRFSSEFEKKLAEYLGVKWSFIVNSGSSANLLAFMTLTSPLLKNRAVKRGEEVITVAAGFPTTIAPIVQFGAVPVFVDVELETFNIDVNFLEKALSSKTKAVMIAHTLGNTFNLTAVSDFCKKHNLWLIEDNCDALGSKYKGKFTGTWGDIGTSSFYPPHHMTMGEGGAVYTDNPLLKKIMLSIRDWGRDCWCDSGVDNTCKHRFSGQHGTLPFGYDHKYVYSHFGYNLKATDMQAAVGCAQLEKFPSFVEKRKENYKKLYDGLKPVEDKLILPKATEGSDPSWFGFLMTLRDDVKFTRNELVEHLENNNIQTRNLFAGNITRHPCFNEMKEGVDYRIAGELKNTDKIMNDSFWIGLYPGMKDEAIDFMLQSIIEFVGGE